MKTTMENKGKVSHDEIAQRAKQIWELEGRQSGRDIEYWLRAERELVASRNRGSNERSNPATPAMTQPAGTGSPGKSRAGASKIIHI